MKGKRPVNAAIIVVIIALVVIGWFTLLRDDVADDSIIASGTVEATEADLGFQTGGRIAEVSVREGDRVGIGQQLATLDADELDARRDGASAQLDAARALLAELERGARPEELAQARATEAVARERSAEAEQNYNRTRVLEEGGAVSREQLDRARSAMDVARAQLAQAEQQRELVQRGPRIERIAAQRAAVRQAEAALAQVEAAHAHAQIRATFPGVVTVRHRQPGETVPAGAPVITVMNPAERWVRIYVREDAVGRVQLGQHAEIRPDSEPGRTSAGEVTFIATEAEFTPRNVQTAEERVKLVYAVKVALTADAAVALKPGMPADVRLLAH
jgi:HlyD family secretion protein